MKIQKQPQEVLYQKVVPKKFAIFTGKKVAGLGRNCKHLDLNTYYLIYHNVCSCGGTYIGETVGNMETIWCKQNNLPSEKSNPNHLNSNITHHFSWSVICKAPLKKFT